LSSGTRREHLVKYPTRTSEARHEEEVCPVSTTVIVLIVVIVVLALAVGGYFLTRQRKSQRLQEHFGDEYERSVEQTGDRKAAEAQLAEREARVSKFDIRDLRPEERDGFTERWATIQRGFVDDPGQSLRHADSLVVEIMKLRGYPVEGDFDRRAEDLSVEHPTVVRHYRDARAVHDASGGVDTEKQRTALTSYRSLVDALLGKGHDHDDDHHDHDGDRSDHHADDRTDRTADVDHADRADHLDHGSRNGVHRADATATTEEQNR
jgi:ABC-type nickel/cobalt efflux system permease component RcnA